MYGLHHASVVLKGDKRATVWAKSIYCNGNVANNGAQSHRGCHASNTRDYILDDVITRLLLVARTFCTGWCSRIFDSETSCTVNYRYQGHAENLLNNM
jgi:hypothetical protein